MRPRSVGILLCLPKELQGLLAIRFDVQFQRQPYRLNDFAYQERVGQAFSPALTESSRQN